MTGTTAASYQGLEIIAKLAVAEIQAPSLCARAALTWVTGLETVLQEETIVEINGR